MKVKGDFKVANAQAYKEYTVSVLDTNTAELFYTENDLIPAMNYILRNKGKQIMKLQVSCVWHRRQPVNTWVTRLCTYVEKNNNLIQGDLTQMQDILAQLKCATTTINKKDSTLVLECDV